MKQEQDMNLYFDKETQHYYYLNFNRYCDLCGKKINTLIFIKVGFSRKITTKNYFCKKCFVEEISFNKLNYAEEVRVAIITNNRPEKSFLIIDKPLDFSSSKGYDVFNMADHNREGEKVIDKTKYAGRDSIEGATIGDQSFINSERDKPLEIQDAFKELDMIAKAKPIEENRLFYNNPDPHKQKPRSEPKGKGKEEIESYYKSEFNKQLENKKKKK